MDDGEPDLQRFLDAQIGTYPAALRELQAGRKTSHWMWFVLPQLSGLGSSAMARRYGIASLDEACAYLRHPVLGARLRACLQALAAHAGRPAADILGAIDAVKLRSCLTLFGRAQAALAAAGDTDDGLFRQLLDAYFDGQPDPATLQILARQA